MQVKFVNYDRSYFNLRPEIDLEMQRVLSQGKLILQEDVQKFEQNLANFVGTKYAVGLNSGTDALYLSLRALGIKKGDEVITVSNTFKSTITSIQNVGAKPILVDIGKDYLMDMNKVYLAITLKTKAIIPVHLSGDVCNMNDLREVIRNKDISIIEDSCQSLGASEIINYKDFFGSNVENIVELTGSIGKIGCFSFYPAKILGCYDEGGAITTNDNNLANEIKEMRNHYKGRPGGLGGNHRLGNVRAAYLNVKFKYLRNYLERRQYVADMYNSILKDLPIILPPNNEGKVWQDYIIRTEKRNELFNFLKNKGIETMIPPELPHIELKLKFKLPKSEEYNKQFLRLPCNADLMFDEILYVSNSIKEFYNM